MQSNLPILVFFSLLWVHGAPRAESAGLACAKDFKVVHHRPLIRLRGGQAETPGPQSLNFGMLRNLLDWSTSLTNVSSTNRTERMDPERIKWLREAMKSVLENTTDIFRQSIEILHEPESDHDSVLRKEQALDAISSRVDNLDLALGLNNMGGFKLAVECLDSAHDSIRCRAADLVAVAVINHDTMQKIAMEYGAFNKLMSIYTNLTQQTETRTKALHAISALIKGNTTCELTFLHQKGLATLRLDMKLKEARLRRKSVFVLSQLMQTNPLLRQAIQQVEKMSEGKGKGLLPELTSLINDPDYQVGEFAVTALLELLRNEFATNAAAVAEITPELQPELRRRLNTIQPQPGESDTEEITQLRSIIALLEPPPA